jgi:N-acetylmuramoyl-L-alanine amidase
MGALRNGPGLDRTLESSLRWSSPLSGRLWRYMGSVSAGGITRRSLIAVMAAAAADGALHPRGAFARTLTRGVSGEVPATLAGLPLVMSGLHAGPGQPPIVARRAWARGAAHPKVAPAYGTVKLAFVHHTENPDDYSAAEVPAMLRSIYAFHRYERGWNDIGYNFVIDRFGRIFEARAGGIDEPVIGAQAGGYNAYSTGIAILGTYGSQRISPAASAALEHLLAWKLTLHGAPLEGHVTVRVTPGGAAYSRYPAKTPVSLPRVAGHRDADSTDCPGDALYGELQALRRAAMSLAGAPAQASLQVRSAEAAGGGQVLVGSLQLLDGTPVAGASVEIQLRTVARKGEVVAERTVAQAVTGSDGRWSLPIELARGRAGETALRALCPGGGGSPTAVSDPLLLAGSVSFSVTSSPGQAPAPSPAESPPPGA